MSANQLTHPATRPPINTPWFGLWIPRKPSSGPGDPGYGGQYVANIFGTKDEVDRVRKDRKANGEAFEGERITRIRVAISIDTDGQPLARIY